MDSAAALGYHRDCDAPAVAVDAPPTPSNPFDCADSALDSWAYPTDSIPMAEAEK